MKDILKLWLQNNLGMEINTEKIANVLKDGMIFIQLLKCYNAVNVNSIKSVFPSHDDDICRNNLTQLKVWFKLIGIDFTDNIINGIINGNTSLCINILYQLFSVFEKNSFNLKTKQTERLCLTDEKKKFKVARSNIPQKHDDHARSSVYSYGDRILKCKDMVDYYQQKISIDVRNKILRRCGSNRSITGDTRAKKHLLRSKMSICPENRTITKKSVQFLDKEDNKSINLCFGDSLSGNLLLQECNENAYEKIKLKAYHGVGDVLLGKSNFLPPIKLKSNLPQHVQNYIKELNLSKDFACKRQTRKCCNLNLSKDFAYERRTRKYCNLDISDVWNLIVGNEKSHLRQTFASRLLKQSMFEKNLGLNLLTILKHNEILKQQYTEIERRIINSRKSVEPISEFEEDICGYDFDCACESSDRGHNSYDECDTPRYFKRNVLRYKFDYYDEYCKNENERLIELNTRLYAENFKIQHQNHHAICYSVLQDITDMAISRSEFKSQFGCELPDTTWEFWKILFYHERPATSIEGNLELLMFLDAPEDMDFSEEMINDNILNYAFLDMYLEESGYWKLDNDESAEEGSDLFLENRLPSIRHESQVLLGYIVHRILEMKYSHEILSPAEIPKYPIMAIIDTIEDSEAVNSLRNLLLKADVLVIEISDAVNFCLQQYKNESKYLNTFRGEENKYHHSSHTTEEFSFSETDTPNKTEFSQTDSNLPEITDEEDLRNVSELGCKVWKKFLSGTEIPTSLIVDMVIQYIKHRQRKIKGWVLVNWPRSFNDVAAIEVALSCKIFPIFLEEVDRTSISDMQYKMETEVMLPGDFFSSFEREVRRSRLVPNPENLNDSDEFKTFFSMYIKTVEGKQFKTRDSNINTAEQLSDNINETTLNQPGTFGLPTLLKFYIDQGIGYEFMYETFDTDTLKQLACIIILHRMEDSKLLKLSEIGFSEELLRELEPTIETKWFTPSSEESDLTFNKTQVSLQFGIEELQYGSHSYIDDTSAASKKKDGFSFADDSILENAALGLANFWETLESLYIVDLKCVLFVMRNLDYSVIPYISSVCKQVEAYLNWEDELQTILTEFLDAYNSIFKGLRSHKQMKNELHLRVVELKGRLKSLCLKHRNSCEELRVNIVRHNWLYQELAICTNLFLHLVESEVTRCLNTLEFLQNYYLSMLGNYSFQRLPTVTVKKLDVYYEESEKEPTLSGYVPSVAKQNSSNIDSYYLSTIDRILNYDNVQQNINPFFEFLENESYKSFNEILGIKSQVDDLIAKEETSSVKQYEEMNKLKMQDKSTSVKNKKGTPLSEAEIQQVNMDKIKEQNIKIFEEWRSSVKNEIARLASRIELVINKAVQKLSNIEDILGNKFYELKCKINDRYLAETICIDNIVELFRTAIEEEVPISAELIFHHNNYYTIPSPVETGEPPVIVLAGLGEMLSEESFTIDQLTHLKDRLLKIAPYGVIPREAFVIFIHSVITYSSSQGNIKLVPKSWNRIRFSDWQTLLKKFFGNNSLIEWRDFLIYCLDLPYPLTEDVIDARMQFLRYDLEETEVITFDDFMKTKLWFEREVPENPLRALRNVLSKEFLFSIFRNTDNTMGYMAFILSMCHDINSRAGFGKALSVVAGRCVTGFHEDSCLEKILTDDINTEFKIVTGILNNIINDVVDGMNRDRSIVDMKSPLSSDIISSSNVNPRLSESMYNQIFRRHLIYRWTSVVPKILIYSTMNFICYTSLLPELIVIPPDFYYSITKFFMNACNSDVHVSDFMNTWWANEFLHRYHEFNSLSTALTIRGLIQEERN